MADHAHEADPEGRDTSPMREFTTEEAMKGGAVLVVGLLVAFGLPLLV